MTPISNLKRYNELVRDRRTFQTRVRRVSKGIRYTELGSFGRRRISRQPFFSASKEEILRVYSSRDMINAPVSHSKNKGWLESEKIHFRNGRAQAT